MAEIENERPAPEHFEDFIRCAVEHFSSDPKRERIKIALDRPLPLYLIAGENQFDRPIKPYRIDSNGREVTR